LAKYPLQLEQALVADTNKAGGPPRQVSRSKDVPTLSDNTFAAVTISTNNTKLGILAGTLSNLPR